jgi:hypothetical protein
MGWVFMTRPTVRDHHPSSTLTLLTRWAGRRTATELLAEDPQRGQQRQALLAQRSALLQGQQVLKNLQQKKYSNETPPSSSSASVADDFGQDTFRMPTPLSDGVDEV